MENNFGMPAAIICTCFILLHNLIRSNTYQFADKWVIGILALFVINSQDSAAALIGTANSMTFFLGPYEPYFLLMAPMSYLYVKDTLTDSESKFQPKYWLPALIYLIAILPFITSSEADRLRTSFGTMSINFDQFGWLSWLFEALFVTAKTLPIEEIFMVGYSLLITMLLVQFIKTNKSLNIRHLLYPGLVFPIASTIYVLITILNYFSITNFADISLSQDLVWVFGIICFALLELLRILLPKPVEAQAEPANTNEEKSQKSKYRTSSLDDDTSKAILDILISTVKDGELYLDDSISLSILAEKTGFSSNQVSQVINQQLEHNFFDFINDFRVDYAKEMLTNKKQLSTPIVDIAVHSGFKSKSAFYSAFKKRTGASPGDYRKSNSPKPVES